MRRCWCAQTPASGCHADELADGVARDPGPAAGVGRGEYGRKAPPPGTAPPVTGGAPARAVTPAPGAPPAPSVPAPAPPPRFVVWDAARGEAVIVGTDRTGIPAGVDAAWTARTHCGWDGGSSDRTGLAIVRAELDAGARASAEITGVPARRSWRSPFAERPAAIIMGGGANLVSR